MNQSQPDPKAALPLPASSPDDLWQMALNDLRYQVTKATFNNWLVDSSILTSASSPVFLVIVVRNIYAWEWLTYRLHPVVTRTVVSLVEGKVTVCFIPRMIQRNIDELTRRPIARICLDSAQNLYRTDQSDTPSPIRE
jgi:chromosomal replication initiation ATPase DnaA